MPRDYSKFRKESQPDKFDHNNIDVPTYVLQRRSTVSACSPLRIIDEGGSDTITPSKKLVLFN